MSGSRISGICALWRRFCQMNSNPASQGNLSASVWDRLHGDKGHIQSVSVLGTDDHLRNHGDRICRLGPAPVQPGPGIRLMLPDRYPKILLFQPFFTVQLPVGEIFAIFIGRSLIFPLGIFVAQYSVHATAGLKPDYGIHIPNIRSPEDGLKGNVRPFGVIMQPESRFFRKGCHASFTRIP